MKLFNRHTHEEIPIPGQATTFRGDTVNVVRIEQEPSPGRSGKLEIEDQPGRVRTIYPGVVDGYLAEEPTTHQGE